MVSYKPLGDSSLRVFQGIVVLDGNGVNILIDVGWDELLSPKSLEKLIDMIPEIDVILLTHPTIGHTGAFCYLRHKYPEFRAIPAYATLPVIRMSQMMTLDTYRTMGLCGAFDCEEVITPQDVELIWSEVHNVKYSQPLHLHFSPKVEGTVITAYNAGHSLGGSLWKIGDGIDNIVVAFDWNHARDAHLSGAFLEPKTGTVVNDLQKPSILITSTNTNSGLPLTKARQQFLDYLNAAISKGGTVLIPTSSGSRVLELMLILDKHLAGKKNQVPLIYCSYHGKQSMTQASSMLEWMVPSIISDWQLQNESPFDTRNVRYAKDYAELKQKWPQTHKIILADGEALESGPSKEIFYDAIVGDDTSSVILTEICPEGTLGHELVTAAGTNELTHLSAMLPPTSLATHEYLKGNDLKLYNEKQEEILRNANEEVEQSRRNKELIDASAMEEAAELSESEGGEEEEEVSTDGSAILLGDSGVYDYQCATLDKRANKMFPFLVKKRKADDYGAFIPSSIFSSKRLSKNSTKDEDLGKEADVVMEDAIKSEPKKEAKKDNEKPKKLVMKRKNKVKAHCWFANADMNGLSNLRSLQMILKQVQPSKVIAIPGASSVVEYLSSAFTTFALADKDVSFDRTDFSVDVRLDPTMKLKWHNLYGGYAVTRVAGKLEFDPHDKIKRFTATLVAPSPEDEAANDVTTSTTTIGLLKLTALRKVLMESGLKAEFRGQNTLVCNDKVVVTKSDNGSYVLDGGIDEDYYKVRTALRRFITTI